MQKTTYEKIQELCIDKSISINYLEKTVGIGTAVISGWKNATPNSKQLLLVADYFNVSTDYLLGRSELSERADEILDNDDIKTVHRAVKKMDCKEKDRFKALLKLTFDIDFGADEYDTKK